MTYIIGWEMMQKRFHLLLLFYDLKCSKLWLEFEKAEELLLASIIWWLITYMQDNSYDAPINWLQDSQLRELIQRWSPTKKSVGVKIVLPQWLIV